MGSADSEAIDVALRVADALEGIGAATLWMKSPEDTVLRKLIWYRLGGEVSDQQWCDIVSVLRISAAELDNDYLTRVPRRKGRAPPFGFLATMRRWRQSEPQPELR